MTTTRKLSQPVYTEMSDTEAAVMDALTASTEADIVAVPIHTTLRWNREQLELVVAPRNATACRTRPTLRMPCFAARLKTCANSSASSPLSTTDVSLPHTRADPMPSQTQARPAPHGRR